MSSSEIEFQKSLNALFKTIEPESTEFHDASPALASTPPLDCESSANYATASPIPSLMSALDVPPTDPPSPSSDARSFSLEFFETSTFTTTADRPFVNDLHEVLKTECKQRTQPSILFGSMLPVNQPSVSSREMALQNRYV